MTREKILEVAAMVRADTPIGIPFVDDCFNATGSPYYRFLYYLAMTMKPTLVVELGSYRGGSTAHLVAAANGYPVIAVDPAPQPEFQGVLGRYPNIDWRKDKSLSQALLDSVADESVDLCFVDAVHCIEQVIPEYEAWGKKMKKVGGVMLFDDITLDDSMIRAWTKMQTMDAREKISLPQMHYSGFGAVLF